MRRNTVSSVIRRCYAAYVDKDRESLEGLLRDDFTFSSPQDDHIDRKTYFKRCWPFHKKVRSFRLEKLFTKGNEGIVRYLCETKDGSRFRNVEFFRLRQGKVREVDVYFGRSLR